MINFVRPLQRSISFACQPSKAFALPVDLCGKRWTRLNRSVLQITGPDAVKFLNGLCTNNVQRLVQDPEVHGLYAAFLSAQQGRVLFEGFLYKVTPDCLLLEVAEGLAFDAHFHLRNYLVRNRVTIEDVSEKKQVLLGWNRLAEPMDGAAFFHDPRANWRITRYVLPKGQSVPWPVEEENQPADYHRLRLLWGIAEGPQEIPRKQAIPLEYNLDWMQAIDFSKGCYLGQELVARTHSKGVVRKRVMPVLRYEEGELLKPGDQSPLEGRPLSENLYAADPADCKSVTEMRGVDAGKPLGQLITLQGSVGLAMIRLDDWHQRQEPNLALNVMTGLESTAPNWHLLRPYRPLWWPEQQ